MHDHYYETNLTWTGNSGLGTTNYADYERSHIISVAGKPDILASSDSSFRGDKNRHNPEDLFVASISACHMLWYLHLCSVAGVVVLEYIDHAKGTMRESGGGQFTEVVLHPEVLVASISMIEKAKEIHYEAHKMCFIANSCNFPITQVPIIKAVDVVGEVQD